MNDPPKNDAAPRPGEDGTSSDADALSGISAACPKCWYCGGEAMKTVVLLNGRQSMLIAVGTCTKHMIGTLAEMNNLQNLAFKLGGGS